jgi:uncharacterized protein
MINYRLLCCVSLFVAALTLLGFIRLDIDTDVVRSLPKGERLIADGLDIFEHHPIHDQIAVDIMLGSDDPDTLVEIGALLEKKMEASGLFAQVGIDATSALIPDLAIHAAQNLPLLFSLEELEEKVVPLLDADQINRRIHTLYQDLSSIEGIGQADFIGIDPLGLKDLILGKLAPLAPSTGSRFYRGKLLSADGRHLLVTARPRASGTDTASARELNTLLDETAEEIISKYAATGQEVVLTPVGAYRAALDNERIIRHDVQLALILATAGIGLLLLIAFPRPLIGLLSLVPALAGIGSALFIYSLLHHSISIMVLGFGGAVISITVDHGIAYLLFLDRSHETRGKDASIEVRAIGIMAVITSIGAFLILSFSGFPVFVQLGQFTALGIFFSFVFVHSVFPRIFPTMPPGSRRNLPLRHLVDVLYRTGKPGFFAAIIVALILLFFAKPQFHTSLSSMNTVSASTIAADEMFTEIWGNSGKQIFLMNSADSISKLQTDNDRVLKKIESDIKGDILSSAFVPSMIFPGPERGQQNLADWHTFWNRTRIAEVQESLQEAGTAVGFTTDAFAGFLSMLDPSFSKTAQTVPEKFYTLLGISKNEQTSSLIQFITVIPDHKYSAESFFSRYGTERKIFDSVAFTGRLAEILVSTFTTMLAIIAASAAVLLFLFYLNLPLTILTLLPPLFAYVCTLGTLNLIGRPLDIPALMLSIVVFGMGIDYSIFCVRAHQRYRRIDHPSYGLVRVAVFMAGASTLIGFGVLCFAEHSLLNSIGVTSLLGIGYSLIGTFLLLPPLMNFYQKWQDSKVTPPDVDLYQRIRARYRSLEAYPRMFVRLKLRFDPMFTDLPKMFDQHHDIRTIIDIGCGYGVPACWCLEHFKSAHLYGIDPDIERVRVTSIATGDRGNLTDGFAPALPDIPDHAEIVLVLDMLHYLDDETALRLFQNSFQILGNNGRLITRYVSRPACSPSFSWRLEDLRVKLSGNKPHYRTPEHMADLMENAGFTIELSEVSRDNAELFWLVAGKPEEITSVSQ